MNYWKIETALRFIYIQAITIDTAARRGIKAIIATRGKLTMGEALHIKIQRVPKQEYEKSHMIAE